MDAFFKLEDGDIQINDGVAMNIKLARMIIRRDRGGKIFGDAKGLKKMFAKRELAYVWYLVNVNSPGIRQGLTGQELHDKAVHDLDLPDDYKPDKTVKEFIEYYRDYHDTAVVKTIKQLIKGFKIIYDSNDTLLNYIKQEVKKPDKSIDEIMSINKAQKELMSISNDVPKLAAQLKELLMEFNSIDNNLGVGLGNVPITSSMIPDE